MIVEDWELEEIVDEAEERGYRRAIHDFIAMSNKVEIKGGNFIGLDGLIQFTVRAIAQKLEGRWEE